MRNIHITLVGGQPSPVHAGIKYINPDEIVFICSEQTYEDAEKIKKMYSSIECKIETINPNHLGKIHKKVIEIYERYKDLNISINLTSGTKSWSLILYEVFANTEAKIILVDQNGRIWDFREKTSLIYETQMEELFVKGTPDNFIKFEDFSDEDKQVIKDIEELIIYSHDDFFRLVNNARSNSDRTEINLNNGDYLKWDKLSKTFTMKIGKKIKKLFSKHVRGILLNTGWFEYKVASLLYNCDLIQDIWMNCIFKYKNDAPKNEFDIVAFTGNKLLFVECKNQIGDNTDIDKFAEAARNFGGMGCKRLFVTNEKMKPNAKEKCKDNDVLFLCLADYETFGEQLMALSKLLNLEMNTSNAK